MLSLLLNGRTAWSGGEIYCYDTISETGSRQVFCGRENSRQLFYIPEQEVYGDKSGDLLVVGWGGTYGHLYETMETMQENGKKVALAHFKFINPLPKNTAEVLMRYKKVVVAEQNNGQFANYLRGKVAGFNPHRFNRVKGQPFIVARLVEEFTKILEA